MGTGTCNRKGSGVLDMALENTVAEFKYLERQLAIALGEEEDDDLDEPETTYILRRSRPTRVEDPLGGDQEND